MMKQRKLIETHVVETEYGFFDVEIYEVTDNRIKETYYEGWLGHQDYGIKSSMYGMSKERVCLQYFVDKILSDVDEYAEFYYEDYMD